MELPLTWWWGIATKWQYPNKSSFVTVDSAQEVKNTKIKQ